MTERVRGTVSTIYVYDETLEKYALDRMKEIMLVQAPKIAEIQKMSLKQFKSDPINIQLFALCIYARYKWELPHPIMDRMADFAPALNDFWLSNAFSAARTIGQMKGLIDELKKRLDTRKFGIKFCGSILNMLKLRHILAQPKVQNLIPVASELEGLRSIKLSQLVFFSSTKNKEYQQSSRDFKYLFSDITNMMDSYIVNLLSEDNTIMVAHSFTDDNPSSMIFEDNIYRGKSVFATNTRDHFFIGRRELVYFIECFSVVNKGSIDLWSHMTRLLSDLKNEAIFMDMNPQMLTKLTSACVSSKFFSAPLWSMYEKVGNF